MTSKNNPQSAAAMSAARSYRAALARLERGETRHADHAGRPVKITPASVAREAGRSRNPLYTTHRDILDEIKVVSNSSTPAECLTLRIQELESIIWELRAEARQHAKEKRELATENLTLLHRARTAEEKLAAHSSVPPGPVRKQKHHLY